MARLPAWVLIAATSVACGGGSSDQDPPGLVGAAASTTVAVDVAAARTDAGELARAVAQPWRVAAAALGDHRLTVRSTVAVADGAAALETLDDTVTIESAAAGDYHATAENSADYGREVIWTGGALYLRPRYARWHQRGPESDDEPAAVRDQLAAVLGDYLDLCARGLAISDQGAATVAGRPGHRLALSLASSPRRVPPERLVQRRWRDTVQVTQLAGEVVLDDALGIALAGELTAAVTFVRDGKPLTMTIQVAHAVEPIAPPAVAAPPAEEVVTTPTRSREVDDRNQLLRGIAPPQGKAATVDQAPEATAP